MKRGAPLGNRNALKTGRHTATARRRRRRFAALFTEIAWALEAAKPFIRKDNRL